MKIEVNVKLIDLDEDYEISPPNPQSALVQLMTNLVGSLNNHPDLQNVTPLIGSQQFPDIEFPPENSTITIDVVLVNTPEDIPMALDNDNLSDVVGAFATSSGVFDDTRYQADRFRVLVACGDDFYRQFVARERLSEPDPSDGVHDLDYLKATLVTIGHEIAHAVEFITHCGGMTPEEVDLCHDEELIEFDMADGCTGRGMRSDLPQGISPEEADFIMEERVEEKGQEWTEWALNLAPPELVERCLKAYAPPSPDPEPMSLSDGP